MMKQTMKISCLILIFCLDFISSDLYSKIANEFEPNVSYESQQILDPKSIMFPEITRQNKLAAITSIKKEVGVLDANIIQNNVKVKLYLKVENDTSRERAKELGDKFVRFVKKECRDFDPNKDIGEGIYDYLIRIFYPEKILVLKGVKESLEKTINWS